jgi:hypothetical protein
MTDTLPKTHICKNCGFMSTRSNLFERVEGLLLCMFCIEQYSVSFVQSEHKVLKTSKMCIL